MSDNIQQDEQLTLLGVDDWDESDVFADIDPIYNNVQVTSRDWTVQTIVDQVRRGNIHLNPGFQRRNVWNDRKRSRLIESIILNVPIPEILLAEIRRGQYAVVDGKQRLLTITGFMYPEYDYWDSPKLKLKSPNGIPSPLFHLHGKKYADLQKDPALLAQFENATIRCTFISNYEQEDVLYDIFNRLNSSSVALNMQELRQALYRGEFSDFLVSATNETQAIHRVMGLVEPDQRLRDVELVLRFISISMFYKKYDGNLRKFLDESMNFLNKNKEWEAHEEQVKSLFANMNQATETLAELLGGYRYVGRRLKGQAFDKRFNKVLFEVSIFYFVALLAHGVKIDSAIHREKFMTEFFALNQDPEFSESIGDTTKGVREYRIRFTRFAELMRKVFDVELFNPFPYL